MTAAAEAVPRLVGAWGAREVGPGGAQAVWPGPGAGGPPLLAADGRLAVLAERGKGWAVAGPAERVAALACTAHGGRAHVAVVTQAGGCEVFRAEADGAGRFTRFTRVGSAGEAEAFSGPGKAPSPAGGTPAAWSPGPEPVLSLLGPGAVRHFRFGESTSAGGTAARTGGKKDGGWVATTQAPAHLHRAPPRCVAWQGAFLAAGWGAELAIYECRWRTHGYLITEDVMRSRLVSSVLLGEQPPRCLAGCQFWADPDRPDWDRGPLTTACAFVCTADQKLEIAAGPPGTPALEEEEAAGAGGLRAPSTEDGIISFGRTPGTPANGDHAVPGMFILPREGTSPPDEVATPARVCLIALQPTLAGDGHEALTVAADLDGLSRPDVLRVCEPRALAAVGSSTSHPRVTVFRLAPGSLTKLSTVDLGSAVPSAVRDAGARMRIRGLCASPSRNGCDLTACLGVVDPAVGQIFNAAPAGQRMELHEVRHSMRVPAEAVAEEAPPPAAAAKGGVALEDSDNGLEPRSLNDSFTQTGEGEEEGEEGASGGNAPPPPPPSAPLNSGGGTGLDGIRRGFADLRSYLDQRLGAIENLLAVKDRGSGAVQVEDVRLLLLTVFEAAGERAKAL